jgi:hypothetical protein
VANIDTFRHKFGQTSVLPRRKQKRHSLQGGVSKTQQKYDIPATHCTYLSIDRRRATHTLACRPAAAASISCFSPSATRCPPGDAAAGILVPGMRNVRDALVSAGLNGIKGVHGGEDGRVHRPTPSRRPRACSGTPSVMSPVVQFLAGTPARRCSPTCTPTSPTRATPGASASSSRRSDPVRDDGNGLTYTNLFDAMVGRHLHAALEKARAPGRRGSWCRRAGGRRTRRVRGERGERAGAQPGRDRPRVYLTGPDDRTAGRR